MSLFVVLLKYLCVHNSSTTAPDALFPSSSLLTTTNLPSYIFEFELQDSSPVNSSIPSISMCRSLEPDEVALFTECVNETAFACATATYQNDPECDEGGFCAPCDPGTYGSAPNNCSACAPGSHGPDPGGTSCFECDAGQYSPVPGHILCSNCPVGHFSSAPGSSTCEQCTEGINFSTTNRSTGCSMCSTECPSQYDLMIQCTATSDLQCSNCPPVANCIYSQSKTCGNSSIRNCNCIAGFEMMAGKCEICQSGFFKDTLGQFHCKEWSQTQCQDGFFLINGTRIHDSVCIPSPSPPQNATTGNDITGWTCNPGYNNTLLWGDFNDTGVINWVFNDTLNFQEP